MTNVWPKRVKRVPNGVPEFVFLKKTLDLHPKILEK
jgi:hypothetical protein